MVLNAVVELDAEGAQLVPPAGIGTLRWLGQEFRHVPLEFANLFVLRLQAGQQISGHRPQFRIEDLLFLREVDGRKVLQTVHDRLDFGSALRCEIQESIQQGVQVFFDCAVILAKVAACGFGFNHCDSAGSLPGKDRSAAPAPPREFRDRRLAPKYPLPLPARPEFRFRTPAAALREEVRSEGTHPTDARPARPPPLCPASARYAWRRGEATRRMGSPNS